MTTTFTIHGTRGGTAVAGRRFSRHGGQTTCFSLRTPRGLVVVDAGTGIASLADSLERGARLPPISLFFTHFHLDHVMGLPLFSPLYARQAAIALLADPTAAGNWRQALKTLMGRPFWPVALADCPARIVFRNLPAGAATLCRHGVNISWRRVLHPQHCLAYRLETEGRSIVIATDHETGQRRLDDIFLRFCRGADLLVYDAQYTPDEIGSRRGWGHGTWLEAVEIARAAGIGELILTHHDRRRTDAQLDAIERAARRVFPRTRAARDGLTLRL